MAKAAAAPRPTVRTADDGSDAAPALTSSASATEPSASVSAPARTTMFIHRIHFFIHDLLCLSIAAWSARFCYSPSRLRSFPSQFTGNQPKRFERLPTTGKKLAEEFIVFETQRLDRRDDSFQDNGDQIAENNHQHAKDATTDRTMSHFFCHHERRHQQRRV